MEYATDLIRTVTVAGHGQTGKTTLVEQLLLAAGVIQKAETVDSGKTVSDHTPEETDRENFNLLITCASPLEEYTR